jgi:hypothetical protein
MLRRAIKGAIGLALVACSALPAYTQAMGTRCTMFDKVHILAFTLEQAGTDYQVGNKLPAGSLGAFKVFRGGPVEIKSEGPASTVTLAPNDCVLISLEGDLHLVAKAPDTQVRVLVIR